MDYKKIDYEKMYEDIMNIDAGIRLVTICDSHGRVVYSEHREGVKNLLTPEESKESLELAVNSWKTRTKLGGAKKWNATSKPYTCIFGQRYANDIRLIPRH